MGSRSLLTFAALCALAAPAGAQASRDVEGTLVRKGQSLGVRTDDGVVRLVRPPRHGLGSRVAHLLAVVPNGTYVKIKPRLRSATQAVPLELLSGRIAQHELALGRDGSGQVDGRPVRVHRRRPLDDDSASGEDADNNEALLATLAGRTLVVQAFTLYDEERRPTDLFLVAARARLKRDSQVTGAPGADPAPQDPRLKAGSSVWFTHPAHEGWLRIRYTFGRNDYRGGYLPSADVELPR